MSEICVRVKDCCGQRQYLINVCTPRSSKVSDIMNFKYFLTERISTRIQILEQYFTLVVFPGFRLLFNLREESLMSHFYQSE